MYAVIRTGGKQYKVAPGQVLEFEKLEAEAGQVVEFDEVLMVGGDNVKVGEPLVAGAKVKGEVLAQKRGEHIISLKFKRRKHHMKRVGHRQHLTQVKITDIDA